MSITASILQAYDQDIFVGSTLTSTVAPSATYLLETLKSRKPDQRVVFGTGTVTFRWTLAGAARGDILCIPMSNLLTGFATLTNSVGLSQALTFPAKLRNGLPKTMVIDLSVGTPVAATRTAIWWELVITANPVNVRMGGAVALFSPKTSLVTRGFRWGNKPSKEGGVLEASNSYLTVYKQDTMTMVRSMDLTAIATDADAAIIEGWNDGNNGSARAGLLWLEPSVQDAMFGHLQKKFVRSNDYTNTQAIGITFTELSKGPKFL